MTRRWWETLPNRLRYSWLVLTQWEGNMWTWAEAEAVCARDHQPHEGDCMKPGDTILYGGHRSVLVRVCRRGDVKCFHLINESMPKL